MFLSFVSRAQISGPLRSNRARSEIHHDGAVLRSTKVLKWRTGEDVPVHVEPKADAQRTKSEMKAMQRWRL